MIEMRWRNGPPQAARRNGGPYVCALLAWMACATLQATVVIPADLVDMTRGATAIVRGRVIDVDARWTGDRRRIESLVRLDVEEYLKGNLGDVVTFKVPGGEIGYTRSMFVGAPTFRAGDQVVLFLSARGPSIPYVFGLSQGVFRIVPGAAGEPVVLPPALMRTTGVQAIRRGDPARRPMPVADFGRLVRQVLAEGAR